MPERPNGAVLKTAGRKSRGFKSLSLRCCPVVEDEFVEAEGEAQVDQPKAFRGLDLAGLLR
jgi:hypothetical protein